MHSHLHQNQNQCMEQPNRMLANGPNHPGPGPEEIPMVDVSIRLSVCPSARPSVRPSVCPSVCLSVRPSICLSICLSVFTFSLKCANALALQHYSRCLSACWLNKTTLLKGFKVPERSEVFQIFINAKAGRGDKDTYMIFLSASLTN